VAASARTVARAEAIAATPVSQPSQEARVAKHVKACTTSQADWTGTTRTSEQDSIPDTTTGTLRDTIAFDGNQVKTSYQRDGAGNATQASHGPGQTPGPTAGATTSTTTATGRRPALTRTMRI
jgi:hypothetical protein